jgi:hypothetical protein
MEALVAACQKDLERMALELVAQLKVDQKETVCDKTPCPLSDEERAILRAFDRYAAAVGDAPAARALAFRRARRLYEHGLFAEAAPGFAALVERHPDDPRAVYAANLMLDCYAMARDRSALQAAVLRLRGSSLARQDPELAQLLAVMAKRLGSR